MMGLGLFWSFLGNSPIYGLHNRSSLCQVFPKQPEVWLPGHLCRWGAVESVDLWWGQVLFPQTTRRVGRLWLRELRAESALWLYGATAAGRPEWRAWTDGSWGTEPENHREREKYPIPFITFPRLNVDFLVEKPYFSHSLESCGFPRWIFQFKSLKKT